MDANVILALLGAAGVFLAFNSLTAPRTVRLEKPSSDEGLMARLQARLDAAELPVTAREFVTLYVVLALSMAGLVLFVLALNWGKIFFLIVVKKVADKTEFNVKNKLSSK